jgi:hypothetical protein
MEGFIFNLLRCQSEIDRQAERARAPPQKSHPNFCVWQQTTQHSDVVSSPACVSAHHPRAEDDAAHRMGQPPSPQSRFCPKNPLFANSSAPKLFSRILCANCAESISDHMYRMAVTLMIMPLPPAIDRSKYLHLGLLLT